MPGRRALLGGALATGISFSFDGRVLAADSPATARPREGDQFVFVSGEQAGKVVSMADLASGAPVLAWPIEPSSKVVRDGSRLNQVLLLRLDEASLDEATRERAAEGIVAYAATCTHAQCPVTGWIAERQVLHCYCHNSEYNPKGGAAVVHGPAVRPLAALPVKIADGTLVAAGGFIGKVGTQGA
jgi:rieske iron-sulfur protein